MELKTTYLGLPLKNPVMPGASPLVDQLDNVRRLEDAGAEVHTYRGREISTKGGGGPTCLTRPLVRSE